MSDINQLCAQLDSFHENIPHDEAARKKLMEAARRLSLALEKPGDTIQRISYLVRCRFTLTPRADELTQ